MLRYRIDRARPGLVAFYDIQPGNGADLFLQPWNPHGAKSSTSKQPVKQDCLLQPGVLSYNEQVVFSPVRCADCSRICARIHSTSHTFNTSSGRSDDAIHSSLSNCTNHQQNI